MSENMKDSGVAWIGEVPDGWNIQPLKYISKCNENVLQENTHPDYKFNYIDIGSVSFEKGIESYQEISFESAPSRARRIVNKGDTIISTVRTYLKAIAFIDESQNVIVSTGFAVLNPNSNINCRYLNYFCKNNGFIQEIEKLSYGIAYPSINTELLIKIPIAYPSIFEQQAISDFLDTQCRKIDDTATNLEKQIDILQKYKKSLITETVTKGLDKSVPMKDSGIEWIGKIPTHWEVKRLKYVMNNYDAQRKPIEAQNRTQNSDILYDYYGASGVIDKIDDYIFDETSLLIGEDGANLVFRNLPLIYIATGKYWVNNHAHILRPKCKNDLMYMAHQMEIINYSLFITGSAQPKLSQENLNNVNLITPPENEQIEIANFLDEKCSQIDSIMESKKEQLSKLQQHKKSLIYEYVTGKKRVKGVTENGN